jgi:hypothetical protein
MAAITFGVIASGLLLDYLLRKTALPSFDEAKSGATQLRPAELACLAKSDDLLHIILVMAVDLTQRAVKATLGGEPTEVLDYETKMWELTKDFLKQYADKKVEPLKPGNFSLNPIGYFRGISALYGSILGLIRRLSSDLAKDPKHLRRYFSVGGIVRLVADFFTAGYQDAMQAELTSSLTKKRLLVSADKCKQFSKIFIATGLTFAAISIAATIYFLPQNLIVPIPIYAVLAALSVQLTIFLKDSIPLYPEFVKLLGHLEREDWRISAVRLILGCLRVLAWATAVGTFMFMIVLSTTLLIFFIPGFPLDYVDLLATLAGVLLVCSSMIRFGLTLQYEQVATSLGHRRLKEARKRISKISPLKSFWEMLKSESYDPQFSEIVAIYGIAPLIILA